jgi:hypothetical protein
LSIHAIAFVEEVSGAEGAADPTRSDAMTITTPTMTATTPITRTGSLWRTTIVAGLGAAAIVTAVATALHGAGVSFAVDGEMIPLAGFAQLTFVSAVIGGVLLAVLKRRSRAARHRFVITTATLTVLSCVPSVMWPDDVATKLTLVALHLLAAAIIVPVLARQADV